VYGVTLEAERLAKKVDCGGRIAIAKGGDDSDLRIGSYGRTPSQVETPSTIELGILPLLLSQQSSNRPQ
jgi:hypothetical protein